MLDMTHSPTRVTLEISLDGGERIAGSVVTRDGIRHPFAGWLDLASALETAVAVSPPVLRAVS